MHRLLSQHRHDDRVDACRFAADAVSRAVIAAGAGVDAVAFVSQHTGMTVCLRPAGAPEARE